MSMDQIILFQYGQCPDLSEETIQRGQVYEKTRLYEQVPICSCPLVAACIASLIPRTRQIRSAYLHSNHFTRANTDAIMYLKLIGEQMDHEPAVEAVHSSTTCRSTVSTVVFVTRQRRRT
ncbi:hypothetical protein MAR_010707 [Mya arenaria]|uniref:Uncharacterized protein n=1 Tax=Mya arenaria TaxID=6604 RepID=A0ABY7FRZ9_MYAAR|nr:hypothetical protein MAR_010707 [Mya arenaria]